VPPVRAGRVDGRELLLRPLWPEDWRQYSQGSVRVSDESLRMRFFHLPPLTERTFRRLTRIDLTAQFAWGAFVGDQLIGVGRYALQAEDRRAAELAVLVADDFQGQGVATRLVTALVAAADAHGATELIAIARAENEPVRRLLGRFGAAFHDGEEDGTVRAQWPVAAALAAADDPLLTASAHAVAAAVLGDVLDR
jgi:acetyltransferase